MGSDSAFGEPFYGCEPLQLINTLKNKVTHKFEDEEECWAIIVVLDKETASVLKEMGSTNADIGPRMRWDEDGKKLVVNLTEFDWWRPEMGIGLIGKEASRLPREGLENKEIEGDVMPG